MLQTNCGTRSNLATDELIPVREIQQLPPSLFDASEKIIGHAGSSPILQTRFVIERRISVYERDKRRSAFNDLAVFPFPEYCQKTGVTGQSVIAISVAIPAAHRI